MMKKGLALILAVVMTLALVACGGNNGANNAGGNAGNANAGGNSTADNGGDTGSDSGEAVTIKVAALESAYEETYPGMWQEICDAFTAQTGINVELTLERNLEDVIGAAMQGGEYPDVIHLATGREAALTEQFIKDKNIADITDVLSMTVPGEDVTVSDKLAAGFTETSITNPYGDGKTYLAPMFYSPCGLFYNAGLFEEKGWEVPTTWDEMWELGDKAKAEGISLFTYPTTGYFDAFFYALMYAVGGPEFFEKPPTTKRASGTRKRPSSALTSLPSSPLTPTPSPPPRPTTRTSPRTSSWCWTTRPCSCPTAPGSWARWPTLPAPRASSGA